MAAEFKLNKSSVLLKSFGGCGVQFNHHVFAQQTLAAGVPRASFDDLREKVLKLAPHFVRVFYNDKNDGVPFDQDAPQSVVNTHQSDVQKDRWASFVDVVGLAQQVGATINITWQGGNAKTKAQRETSMARFANVLERLVKQQHVTNLQWVTVANEPNTKPRSPTREPAITRDGLVEMYRLLDKGLRERGLRRQIRLMGGDLLEGPRTGPDRLMQNDPFNQLIWFRHISKNLHDILDAYSVHIYWDYDDVPKITRRLDGVLRVVGHLQHPKPVYITEFGTRGKGINKDRGVDPGDFEDKQLGVRQPICETTIVPFQHALFVIRAAQRGYVGMVKWDCFFGTYDATPPPKGAQQYFAIGRPRPPHPQAWELHPMYFLLRLITATTARDWKVLSVTPTQAATASTKLKHLAAFQGEGKDLTILGLHVGGARLNKTSNTQVPYAIGGLPARTPFKLLLWNRAGGGKLVLDQTITTNASGEARMTTPLHSVFVLTTKALPADLD